MKIRVAVTGLYSGDSMKMKSETRPQQDIIFQIETDEEDGQEEDVDDDDYDDGYDDDVRDRNLQNRP